MLGGKFVVRSNKLGQTFSLFNINSQSSVNFLTSRTKLQNEFKHQIPCNPFHSWLVVRPPSQADDGRPLKNGVEVRVGDQHRLQNQFISYCLEAATRINFQSSEHSRPDDACSGGSSPTLASSSWATLPCILAGGVFVKAYLLLRVWGICGKL